MEVALSEKHPFFTNPWRLTAKTPPFLTNSWTMPPTKNTLFLHGIADKHGFHFLYKSAVPGVYAIHLYINEPLVLQVQI